MSVHHGTVTIDTPARQEFFDVTDAAGAVRRGDRGGRRDRRRLLRSTPAAASCCRRSPRTSPTTARSSCSRTPSTCSPRSPRRPVTRGSTSTPGRSTSATPPRCATSCPTWGLNTDGHIISSILGRSVTVPPGRLRPGAGRVRPGLVRRPRLGAAPHAHRPLPGPRRLTCSSTPWTSGPPTSRSCCTTSGCAGSPSRRRPCDVPPRTATAWSSTRTSCSRSSSSWYAGAPRGIDTDGHEAVIALTGQAESLVLVDRAGRPTRPGAVVARRPGGGRGHRAAATTSASTRPFAVTGQPTPSATWPAAKLLWLARHEPHTLDVHAPRS